VRRRNLLAREFGVTDEHGGGGAEEVVQEPQDHDNDGSDSIFSLRHWLGGHTGAHSHMHAAGHAPSGSGSSGGGDASRQVRRTKPVVFMSCFKWEMRKGWDVLLAAYLQVNDMHIFLFDKQISEGMGRAAGRLSAGE
jgi:hypothetical protein